MIAGIGTDIIEIKRIEQAFATHGQRFIDKVLSSDEALVLAKRRQPIAYLAKRWAAKEALGKALGTGIRTPVLLPSISLLNDEWGKPYFAFDVALTEYLNQRCNNTESYRLHVSVSDEKNYVTALVVFEILTK